MAKNDRWVARDAEKSTQPQGRTGAETPVKIGPAAKGGSRQPNGGQRGGVFRPARGKAAGNV